MTKTLKKLQDEYEEARRKFKDAERELKSATAEETMQLARVIGKTIIDARYYSEDEGAYVLKTDDGTVVTFSASGDDATSVTMSINAPRVVR